MDEIIDLSLLSELSLETVLSLLKRRFERHCYYTTSSKSLLISINPYNWNHQNYSTENKFEYSLEKQAKDEHLYCISSKALKLLRTQSTNQTILVNGDSGAGKTECIKILIDHVMTIASLPDETSTMRPILDANIILEIFGNAKTSKNDNSSRYGKFIKVLFNHECKVVGGEIQSYLLEKNRVISQRKDESSFHIFYLLMKSDEAFLQKLGLIKSAPFRYLSMNYTNESFSSMNMPMHSIAELTKSLSQVLELDSTMLISGLYSLLAGILYLGELSFVIPSSRQEVNLEWIISPQFSSKEDEFAHANWNKCAELLGISVVDLFNYFTRLAMTIESQEILRHYSLQQKQTLTDSFAMELYFRIFNWLIRCINETIGPSNSEIEGGLQCIGLLDIFGFEIYERNTLEQLLINYANEKLHSLLVDYSIVQIQNEYMDEGLPLQISYDFSRNLQVLNLFEQKYSGIFDTLQEFTNIQNHHGSSLPSIGLVPNGKLAGDQTISMVKALKKQFEDTTINYKNGNSKCPIFKSHRFYRSFTISHFAQEVEYFVESFLECNRTVSITFFDAFCTQSTNPLMNKLISKENNNTCNFLSTQIGKENKESTIRSTSVSKRFQIQLQDVIKYIKTTNVSFVKCMKSNNLKAANYWEDRVVEEQLKVSGIIEATIIGRSSYPVHHSLEYFIKTYLRLYLLQNKISLPLFHNFPIADNTIMTQINLFLNSLVKGISCENNTDYETHQIGNTKLYLSPCLSDQLNIYLQIRQEYYSTRIQTLWRKYYQQLQYKAIIHAISQIQTVFRKYLIRRKMKEMEMAEVIIIPKSVVLIKFVVRNFDEIFLFEAFVCNDIPFSCLLHLITQQSLHVPFSLQCILQEISDGDIAVVPVNKCITTQMKVANCILPPDRKNESISTIRYLKLIKQRVDKALDIFMDSMYWDMSMGILILWFMFELFTIAYPHSEIPFPSMYCSPKNIPLPPHIIAAIRYYNNSHHA